MVFACVGGCGDQFLSCSYTPPLSLAHTRTHSLTNTMRVSASVGVKSSLSCVGTTRVIHPIFFCLFLFSSVFLVLRVHPSAWSWVSPLSSSNSSSSLSGSWLLSCSSDYTFECMLVIAGLNHFNLGFLTYQSLIFLN